MISYAIRRWSAFDLLTKRLVRNVGVIVSGDAGAAALNLAALALTARALGPEWLGILVMIEAYGTLIDRWIRPETWQALIKYGADALAHDDHQAFRRLIKLGFLIDVGGALLAAIVAIAGITVAAGWLAWDEVTASLASLYCFMLILQITSTPTAVLRLFDRFSVFAYSQMAAAVLRLLLTAIAWWLEEGLMAFILIAMAVAAVRPVIMIYAALGELKRRHFLGLSDVRLRGVTQRFPRLWRFLLSTNLSLLLRKTVETTDVLLVGALLGPAASGALHIVKRLSMLIMKLGRPVQQVIYPDVSKLWANGEVERFKKAIIWTNLLGGGVGLSVLAIIAINPAWILSLFAGEDFANLAHLLLAQMAAVVIFMFGLALRPALYSMERDTALLRAVALATGAFYITFFSFVSSLGVLAASLGYAAFNLIWLILSVCAFCRSPVARSNA